MIWMLLTWRYDHHSCNNNLSNCKLIPKTNEDIMSIWSFFASPTPVSSTSALYSTDDDPLVDLKNLGLGRLLFILCNKKL